MFITFLIANHHRLNVVLKRNSVPLISNLHFWIESDHNVVKTWKFSDLDMTRWLACNSEHNLTLKQEILFAVIVCLEFNANFEIGSTNCAI